jgi:hypothetical protein
LPPYRPSFTGCRRAFDLVNSVHVLSAAAIASVIPDPAFAWPLALGSHIALDTVPHWNWHPAGSKWEMLASMADVGLALVLTVWLAGWAEHFWITLIACILSMVPDLIQGPYYMWGWRPRWLQRFVGWESRRQKWPWMRPWMGIATQVAAATGAILLLLSA